MVNNNPKVLPRNLPLKQYVHVHSINLRLMMDNDVTCGYIGVAHWAESIRPQCWAGL